MYNNYIKDIKKYDKDYIVYNKLVRDRVPEIIECFDKKTQFHILDDKEYFSELVKKLQEEVVEFSENNETKELADVLEVIYAILEYKNISKNDLEKIRKELAEKRGGFEKKIFLENVKRIEK